MAPGRAIARRVRLSHLHLAFVDFPAAVSWFKTVLRLPLSEESEHTAVFQGTDIGIAIHPDWGHGDTSATIAFLTDDCERDFTTLIERGAKARSATRDKGLSVPTPTCRAPGDWWWSWSNRRATKPMLRSTHESPGSVHSERVGPRRAEGAPGASSASC